jgi:formyl-CoA transferase
MLNHNRRCQARPKNPKGKEVLTALIKSCDVLVENFSPGCSIAWAFPGRRFRHQPEDDRGLDQGFWPGPYEDCKVYERRPMHRRLGATTGFRDGLPLVTGEIGDSGTGLHLALGTSRALSAPRPAGARR